MWTHGCIGDVLELIQNGVNCKQDKSGLGNKVTRIETIADATINYEKTGFADLDDKQRAKAKLKVGDILFSHINSPVHVGKTAIYDGKEPLFHGINLLRMRTIEKVDSRYFNMFLVSLFTNGYWKRTAKQSVNQASVNQTDIKSVPFSYPPLSEQQRIVAKLDAAFAEIDRAVGVDRERVASMISLEQALLEETFSADYPSTNIGDLGDVKSGGTPKSKEPAYWGGSIQWYSSGELNSLYTSPSEKRITSEGLNNSNAKLFPRGTLLIGMYDTAAMKMSILHEEATFNQAIVGVPPNEFASSEYLFYALKHLKPQILMERRGVRQQNLSLAKIKKIEIPIPDAPSQKQIVTRFRALSRLKESIFSISIKKLNEYQSLKSSILAQELRPSQSEAA